jgi:predicted nucleotide-binding protein (sugar kinase/HSP70/actin superfamily)
MNLLHKPHRSHEARILEALKQAGHYGLWTHELSKQTIGGHRFSEYIRMLRKDGHNIDKVRISNYEYKYYLVQENN